MRTYRFYHPESIVVKNTYLLNSETSHQIITVLRLKTNQQIWLFNNSAFDFAAVIEKIEKNKVWVTISAQLENTKESPCKIHLLQAIAKGSKMDFAIQKAVELGVSAITPLISAHTIVNIAADKIPTRLEHWQKIIVHACSQSGRSIVPTINPPITFTNWISNNSKELKLILSPTSKLSITKAPVADNVSLLIGPEGGFSAEEMAFASQHNCLEVALGKRILRTETAGIVAIAGLQMLFGDLQ